MSLKSKGRPGDLLALLGAGALWAWALAVLLGTGIGYDHPIHSLFGDGVFVDLWRIAKSFFLGLMAWGVTRLVIERLEGD